MKECDKLQNEVTQSQLKPSLLHYTGLLFKELDLTAA